MAFILVSSNHREMTSHLCLTCIIVETYNSSPRACARNIAAKIKAVASCPVECHLPLVCEPRLAHAVRGMDCSAVVLLFVPFICETISVSATIAPTVAAILSLTSDLSAAYFLSTQDEPLSAFNESISSSAMSTSRRTSRVWLGYDVNLSPIVVLLYCTTYVWILCRNFVIYWSSLKCWFVIFFPRE